MPWQSPPENRFCSRETTSVTPTSRPRSPLRQTITPVDRIDAQLSERCLTRVWPLPCLTRVPREAAHPDRAGRPAHHRGVPGGRCHRRQHRSVGQLHRRQRAARAHLCADRRHPRTAIWPGRRSSGAFLVPFLDLGIAQDPMLHTTPPAWAHYLPGYGGFRILTDAILTHNFDQAGPLLIALAWLAGAAVAASVVFRRSMRTAHRRGRTLPRS